MQYTISYRQKTGALIIHNTFTNSDLSISEVGMEDAYLLGNIIECIVTENVPEQIKSKLAHLLESDHAAIFAMFLFCWLNGYIILLITY
jgi:hypothetical protein